MYRLVKDSQNCEQLLVMSEAIEYTFAKRLDEGLIKSYPDINVFKELLKALDKVMKRSWMKGVVFLRGEDANGKPIEVDTFRSSYRYDKVNDPLLQMISLKINRTSFEKIEKDMKRLLEQCGWFIGDNLESDDNKDELHILLEPKFPIDNDRIDSFSNETINRVKVFYHVTFAKYAEKIRLFGLIPSNTSRNEFFHPERIYLFGSRKDASEFMKMHGIPDSKENNDAKRINAKYVGDTGELAPKEYQPAEEDSDKMVMFTINLLQCLKDGKLVKLYHDPHWLDDTGNDGGAYFTQNMIPGKYIKKAEM